MKAISLMDSRKFCTLMDELVEAWTNTLWRENETDEDALKTKLDAVLVFLGVGEAPIQSLPKPSIMIEPAITQLKPAVLRKVMKKAAPEPKPKRAYKRRQPVADDEPQAADKAALLASMRAPLSKEETAQLKAQAMGEAAKVRDPQLVVNDAVEQVIKPNWATTPSVDGCRHFFVKAQRGGESVSFEAEKWKKALELHRLSAGNVTFKPEGLGMSPGSLDTARSKEQIWRVMIG